MACNRCADAYALAPICRHSECGRVGDSLGVTNQNLKITRTGDKEFLVTDGGDFKCTIKVDGPEGAYKISNVSK